MRLKRFKIRFWLGVAVAAIALGVPTTAQATTNVVPNPGFEENGCSNTPTGQTPIICGWHSDDLMSRWSPHSGKASMALGADCGPIGCYPSVGVSATTDRAFCASIGPGAHPASLWYLPGAGGAADAVYASLSAVFYQAPDCTGASSTDFISEMASWEEAWQMLSGELLAPAGTESALFAVAQSADCEDWCRLTGKFDDVYVGATGLAPTKEGER